VTQPLSEFARAVPYLAVSAYGLGPDFVFGANPQQQLASLRSSREGLWGAVETAGSMGRQLLQVLATLDGNATSEQIAFQTRSANQESVSAGLDRLEAARLIERRPDGSVILSKQVAPFISRSTTSMSDQDAVRSDELAHVCKSLGLKPPSRKQERIDAIAAVFADEATAATVYSELSSAAQELLAKIVDIAGVGPLAPEKLDLNRFSLRTFDSPYYTYQGTAEGQQLQALKELTNRGIVGISDWDYQLWIWHEAWPLTGSPLFSDWQTRPKPVVEPVETATVRVPNIVAVLDRAITAWQASPPSVLKNGDPRLAKTDLRKLAKSLGTDIETIDVASRLAIGIELLLANTVAESGRGRNRTFDQVWLPDPKLVDVWGNLAPLERWLALVAEWCRPKAAISEQLLVNRHLLLWELTNLETGTGWADAGSYVSWFADHYARLGDSGMGAESLKDLRALGIASQRGPVAMTALGALAMADPAAASTVEVGDSLTAIVQADHTVIAPPDLQASLVSRLATIALLESDAGAFIYRLDSDLITRAVQGDEDPDSIIDFLTQLSSVPLPNNVEWLVRDAAKLANRVKVIAAPTVVVVTDPADLIVACSIKAAKLVAVSDTVAVSDLPHAKIRTALDRKGLAPEVVLGGSSRPPRTQVDQQRVGYRATPRGIEEVVGEVPGIDEIAESLRVVGPLAVTPALVDLLDAEPGT
jgi:hypothetical protein